MTELMNRLLSKPVGPTVERRGPSPDSLTREIEAGEQVTEVELRGVEPGDVAEDVAVEFLREQGLNPDEWDATGFRASEWTRTNGELGISKRYTYKRKAGGKGKRPPIDELVAGIKDYRPKEQRANGEYAAIVALGDMQFGKSDGDGTEGSLARCIEYLDRSADAIVSHMQRFPIGHIHVAWLGDHIEGFTSQGGANTWRTPLTLNEQIRLTRAVMLHSLKLFGPMADRVSMVAVPGNHGEPQRFAGKGVTRYDDSHDTEALIAVKEAADLSGKFEHVEFYVPDTDELSVVTDVGGLLVAHHHGHMWRPNQHFAWWRGQAFHAPGFSEADVLLAGHFHHLQIEQDGRRTFIQVPALESDSTWFRHTNGSTGYPGIVLGVAGEGVLRVLEVVR